MCQLYRRAFWIMIQSWNWLEFYSVANIWMRAKMAPPKFLQPKRQIFHSEWTIWILICTLSVYVHDWIGIFSPLSVIHRSCGFWSGTTLPQYGNYACVFDVQCVDKIYFSFANVTGTIQKNKFHPKLYVDLYFSV